MFDLDAFLADLVVCTSEVEPRRAAKEVVARAVSNVGDVAERLTPPAGGLTMLHHSPELTVMNVALPPALRVMPHDHRMWALIGVYAGAEDNQFFRRGETGLVATNGRRLDAGAACLLGAETIHAVANPSDRLTCAIHVYGGDFVRQPRSQWGPGDLVERSYDMAEVNRQFETANRAAGLVTS